MNKALFQIHAAVFLFGFAGLFGKFLSCDPLLIVLGRTFFAAVALWIYAGIKNRILSGFTRNRMVLFILQGILLAFHWWTFFVSIRISSVAVGLVTFSTFPLFVTFMEPLFFRERLKKTDIATAAAVFTGILFVVPDLDFTNNITVGAIYGILSGFTFALLALVNRKNARETDTIAVAFYQNLFAAICLFIPVVILKTPMPVWSDLAGLVFLGVICTALSHSLFIQSLTRIRAQTASVIAGLEPVYGIILAFFMLQEVPQSRTLIGGVIIISATFASGFLDQKK